MKLNIAPAWRLPLLIWALLVALLFWSQWPAVSGMALLWWRSETFAHAMLVPPISAWLVWRRRAELAQLAPSPWWAGMPLLLVAVCLGTSGWLTEVNVLQHFGVVLSLQLLTLCLFGLRVGRLLGFALLFLLFAPPFGEFMTEPMMQWTADFVVPALRFVGVPVYREGLHFVIPSGNWSVVEACSGIRYLMASVMVGTLFAYLNFSSLRGRLAFIAVSILVPIVANWLRAFMIVMLGHLSNNKIATGVDHLVYGWVFFGVVMMLMFWIGARFAGDPPALQATSSGLRAAAGSPTTLGLAFLVLGALLMLPSLGAQSLRRDTAPVMPGLQGSDLSPPVSWQALPPEAGPWKPIFLGKPLHLQQRFTRAGAPAVTLDLAFYPLQRGDSKAINSMNTLVDSHDDHWSGQGRQLVAGDPPVQQSRWLLRSSHDAGEHVARRLYWVDGEWTASERRAKWLALIQLLRGRGEGAAALVWMTPAADDGEARLDAFWRDFRTPLNERLVALSKVAGGHNPAPFKK